MNSATNSTLPARPSLLRRIVSHWISRLLLTVGLFVLLLILLFLVTVRLFAGNNMLLYQEGIGAMSALGAIVLITLLVERRTLAEVGLGLRGFWPQWLRGVALGASYMSICVAIVALLGGYRVTALNAAFGPLLFGLLFQVLVGFFEELLFRGILFRLLEEGLGSWAALLVSATFFGVAHILNPEATLWGALAITIEAGILFGTAYMFTRSLWFVAGLHTAWNFLQGPVFGINISGSNLVHDSLLIPSIQGPDLLTGGAFGIEASLVAVLLGLALGIWYAVRVVRAGRTMRPLLWRGGINRLNAQHER